ncbi:hypothetical protein, partial [Pseudolactococcus insecticola]
MSNTIETKSIAKMNTAEIKRTPEYAELKAVAGLDSDAYAQYKANRIAGTNAPKAWADRTD